jgi:hypothetical protein
MLAFLPRRSLWGCSFLYATVRDHASCPIVNCLAVESYHMSSLHLIPLHVAVFHFVFTRGTFILLVYKYNVHENNFNILGPLCAYQ